MDGRAHRDGASRQLKPVRVSLVALFALTVTAIAAVASSRICARAVAMPMDMPAMAGMPMPAVDGRPALCPVVLALTLASTLLAAWAILVFAREPGRRSAARGLAAAAARLPLVSTFLLLAAGGASAVAAIVVVDGGVTFSADLLAALITIVGGGATIAAALTTALGRLVCALWTRLQVAVTRSLAERRPLPGVRVRAVRLRRSFVDPVAHGNGLRAPPLPV